MFVKIYLILIFFLINSRHFLFKKKIYVKNHFLKAVFREKKTLKRYFKFRHILFCSALFRIKLQHNWTFKIFCKFYKITKMFMKNYFSIFSFKNKLQYFRALYAFFLSYKCQILVIFFSCIRNLDIKK